MFTILPSRLNHADWSVGFHRSAKKKQTGHTFATPLLRNGRLVNMKIAHTSPGGLSVRFFSEVVN
jgi:hypothetical protein